jgi:hypothetical protein
MYLAATVLSTKYIDAWTKLGTPANQGTRWVLEPDRRQGTEIPVSPGKSVERMDRT